MKFNQLAKYDPNLIADNRASIGKFLTGVSSYVVKECRSAMLNSEINLSRLMTHAQQIESDKIKERDRVKRNKRARSEQPTYGKKRSQGGNHPEFQSRSSMPTPLSAIAPALRGRQEQGNRSSMFGS